GTAIGDCWQALLRGWADPEVTRWSERARSPREISGAGVTPYRDDDVAIGSLAPAAPAAARPEAEPAPPAATFGIHDAGAQAAADEHVLDVALGRRYDLAPVRVSAAHRGAHYVHVLG